MQPATAKRLLDALRAAERACGFAAALRAEQFAQNALVQAAVERQLEIIGEALNRARTTEPMLEAQVPELHRIIACETD